MEQMVSRIGMIWEKTLLNFVLASNFGLVNIFYEKRKKYLVTFKNENNRRQIDMVRRIKNR